MTTDSIGTRVKACRERHGWTQAHLADLAGYTRTYIGHIEAGRRAVTAYDTLSRLAAALRVDLSELRGQPPQPSGPADMAAHVAVAGIRRALDGPDMPVSPRPLAELAHQVGRARAAHMACDWDGWATLMPDLLAEVFAADSARPDDDTRETVVRACFTAAMTLKQAGHLDLAHRLCDRGTAAARLHETASTKLLAACAFASAQTSLATGSRHAARTKAETAAQLISPEATTADGEAVALYGMLLLHAGLSSAALGDHTAASEYMDLADDVARHASGNHWALEFGPANARMWRMATVLDGPNPDRAVQVGRSVDPRMLSSLNRRTMWYMDMARGLHAQGAYDRAVTSLLIATDMSPRAVRLHSPAMEIVAQMVRTAPRRTGHLATLAGRVGFDPGN